MFNYFLQILDQKCGNYVCVQLLQTLNIIFENIKNKTALCKCLYRIIIIFKNIIFINFYF